MEILCLLSALPVYQAAKYSDSIWDWFTTELKRELSCTTWNPDKQCIEEQDSGDEDLLKNIYGAEELADWEEVDSLNVPDEPTNQISLDLSLLFNPNPTFHTGVFDENASLPTMKTATSNATNLARQLPNDIDLTQDDTSNITGLTTASDSSPAPHGASSQRAGVSVNNG